MEQPDFLVGHTDFLSNLLAGLPDNLAVNPFILEIFPGSWTYDTFEDNHGIKNDFTKYLR